ncbi:MAG: dienelactone hydrolase family protein [Proteobacteria bacterium]|nr:dienelactone hydrolase family protein [Pseudomonadota bacterium]
MRLTLLLLLATVLTLAGPVTPVRAAGNQVAFPGIDGQLQLTGYWYEAPGDGPRPVVISLHGCGGMLTETGQPSPSVRRDASYFNSENIHVLAIDSFTPRGRKSICEIPMAARGVDERTRRGDVFAAIDWLAGNPKVDKNRIVVLGRSHGGQTVLKTLDRSDPEVRARALMPRAAIALYPGCLAFARQPAYEIAIPLLVMIGELDNWTLASACRTLQDKVRRAQKDATFELTVYPGSYHGFDGTEPVHTKENLPNIKAGQATVGSNPEARIAAHARTFDFVSAQFGQPLRLSHDRRSNEHHYVLPPPSGFAAADEVAKVPLGEKGRARYQRYLELESPKAFVITEKNGWAMIATDPEAMQRAFDECARARVACWLYAVDDRVVWNPAPASRVGPGDLRRP